jgi:hypothetical protein
VFKQLSELTVRVFDLVEAEGRVLRKVLARLGLGLSLTIVAAALVLVGVVLVLAAVWIGVDEKAGHAWASLVSGLLCLVIAAGMLWGAVRLSK